MIETSPMERSVSFRSGGLKLSAVLRMTASVGPRLSFFMALGVRRTPATSPFTTGGGNDLMARMLAESCRSGGASR
jgi:hypothetical protein